MNIQSRKRSIAMLMLFMAVSIFSFASEGINHFPSDHVSKSVFTQLKNSDACFSYVFPLGLMIPGKGQMSISSEQEFEKSVSDYFEAHPDTEQLPSIVFPIRIQTDGHTVRVATEEDLDDLFEACYAEELSELHQIGEMEGSCFTYAYPITINRGGKNIQLNSEEDWDKLASPEAELEVEIAFPLTVIRADGSKEVVRSEAQLEELADACYGLGAQESEFSDEMLDVDICYEYVYPVSMEMPDGKLYKVASEEAFDKLIDQQLDAGFEFEELPEVAYPYTVKKRDGTQVRIKSEKDLIRLEDSCR